MPSAEPDPKVRRQAIAFAELSGCAATALEETYDAGWRDRTADIGVLYDRVKDLENTDGSASGGDVLMALNTWFGEVGFDTGKRLLYIDVMRGKCPDAPGLTLTSALLQELPTVANDSQLATWWASLGVGTVPGMWLHIAAAAHGGPARGVVQTRRVYVTEEEYDSIVNLIDNN